MNKPSDRPPIGDTVPSHCDIQLDVARVTVASGTDEQRENLWRLQTLSEHDEAANFKPCALVQSEFQRVWIEAKPWP